MLIFGRTCVSGVKSKVLSMHPLTIQFDGEQRLTADMYDVVFQTGKLSEQKTPGK